MTYKKLKLDAIAGKGQWLAMVKVTSCANYTITVLDGTSI